MWNNNYIKGTVYPKIKIPNLCGFLFLRGIQKKILKNFGNKTILVTIVCFHCMVKKHSDIYQNIFFRVSQ